MTVKEKEPFLDLLESFNTSRPIDREPIIQRLQRFGTEQPVTALQIVHHLLDGAIDAAMPPGEDATSEAAEQAGRLLTAAQTVIEEAQLTLRRGAANPSATSKPRKDTP